MTKTEFAQQIVLKILERPDLSKGLCFVFPSDMPEESERITYAAARIAKNLEEEMIPDE